LTATSDDDLLPTASFESGKGSISCGAYASPPVLLSRRGFTGFVSVSALAEVACGYQTPGTLTAVSSLPPKRLLALRDLDSSVPWDFEFPNGHAAFLVRLGRPADGGVGPGQDIVAYHRACPHMGCPLTIVDIGKAELGPCSCHRSRFNLATGGVQTSGMASQNLVQIVLEEREVGVLYAVGIMGLPYGVPLEEGR